MKRFLKIFVLIFAVSAMMGIIALAASAETSGTEESGHNFTVEYVFADDPEKTYSVTVNSSNIFDFLNDPTLRVAGFKLGTVGQYNVPVYMVAGNRTTPSATITKITLGKAPDGSPLTYYSETCGDYQNGKSTPPYKFWLGNTQNIEVDLGGNTLSTFCGWIMGDSGIECSGCLTFRNGTIAYKGQQFFQSRWGTTLIFDNVYLNDKGGKGALISDGGAANIILRNNTVFDISKGSTVRLSDDKNVKNDYSVSNFVIEDSVFIGGANSIGITDISGRSIDVNFYILGLSSIDASSGSLINIGSAMGKRNVYTAPGLKLPDGKEISSVATDRLTVLDSLSFDYSTMTATEGSPLDEYIFADSCDVNYPNQLCTGTCSVTLMNGEDEVAYLDGIAKGARFEYEVETSGSSVNPDDGRLYIEVHEGWLSTAEGAAVTPYILATEDSVFNAVIVERCPAIAAYKNGEVSAYSLDTELSLQEILSFKNTEIVFYDDITFTGNDVISDIGDITLNLNGHTFNKNKLFADNSAAFLLSDGDSVTVKDGTVCTSMTPFAILNSESASVTLEGVDVIYDTVPAFTVNSGTLDITDSSVSNSGFGASRPIVKATSDSGKVEVKASSSSVSTDGAFVEFVPNNTDADINIVVSDSEIVCGTAFKLPGTLADRVGEGSSLQMSITNSAVNTKYELADISYRTDGKTPFENAIITVSESMLTVYPTAGAGKVFLGTDEAVSPISEGVYSYKVTKPEFEMKYNLTIYEDMSVNFYLPIDTNVTALTYNDTEYNVSSLETAELSYGTYYVFTVNNLPPHRAAEDICVGVKYTVDTVEKNMEMRYSVITYLDTLLSGDEDLLYKHLAANTVKYIGAAYDYTGLEKNDDLTALLESANVAAYAPVSHSTPKPNTDKGNISVAITSAQLSLSSELKLRFNLNASYTGSLTVGEKAYEVESGVTEGKNYIEVVMNAYDLAAGKVTITGESEDGTAILGAYSLAAYVEAMKTSPAMDEYLVAMLDAFYNYCYGSSMYIDGGSLPPVDTPDVEVEFE